MKTSLSKHYELELYREKCWGFGFWIMRRWFGTKCFGLKMVLSKKCELIEPLESPKFEADLSKCANKLSDQIAKAFCWGTHSKKVEKGPKIAPIAPKQR